MIQNKILGFILTVLLGLVSGILGGALGLVAATLALPGYIILGLVPNVKTSIGTTLLSSPESWGAVYKYYKAGQVEIIRGIVYSIFYIIGAYFGASITLLLNTNTVTYLVSAVHFLLGGFFLYRGMM